MAKKAGLKTVLWLTRSMRTSRVECGIGLSHLCESAVTVVPVEQNLTITRILERTPVDEPIPTNELVEPGIAGIEGLA